SCKTPGRIALRGFALCAEASILPRPRLVRCTIIDPPRLDRPAHRVDPALVCAVDRPRVPARVVAGEEQARVRLVVAPGQRAQRLRFDTGRHGRVAPLFRMYACQAFTRCQRSALRFGRRSSRSRRRGRDRGHADDGSVHRSTLAHHRPGYPRCMPVRRSLPPPLARRRTVTKFRPARHTRFYSMHPKRGEPMTATANISDRISRLTEEGLIGMVEAAASMGTFRGGRPCHPSTIARWSTKGIRLANGEILKLEVLRCG